MERKKKKKKLESEISNGKMTSTRQYKDLNIHMFHGFTCVVLLWLLDVYLYLF